MIENRVAKKIQPNTMICAYHRYELGTDWRRPKRCHPNHPILLGKKAPTVRTVPYKVVMRMLQEGHQIPIGTKFCFHHLKSENNGKNNGKDSSTPSTRKDTANLMHESSMEPDVDFVPDVPYISSSDLESSLLISESLSPTLETSPLLFRIKKKKVSYLSEGTNLNKSS